MNANSRCVKWSTFNIGRVYCWYYHDEWTYMSNSPHFCEFDVNLYNAGFFLSYEFEARPSNNHVFSNMRVTR